MAILITGGAGYIGSHTCVELLESGHSLVVADNFSNSNAKSLDGIRKITKKDFLFYETDITNEDALNEIFENNEIDCIIHFAGFKAVAESVAKPIMYYENNVGSMISLCKMMQKHGVKKLIFSSSATVYKGDSPMPLTEDSPLGAINPYGWSKLMSEQILRDAAVANKDWSFVLLRYFNPVGAHPSGIIGENPKGIPNNLMPLIAQTAQGIHSQFTVTGDDYDTPDGTGVRDYIHVVDLAAGHVKAVNYCEKNIGCEAFNLGTGNGISVLEMIEAFKKVNNVTLPYSVAGRRPGDNPTVYANPSKAERVLGFKAEKTLDDMCKDTWRYQDCQHTLA